MPMDWAYRSSRHAASRRSLRRSARRPPQNSLIPALCLFERPVVHLCERAVVCPGKRAVVCPDKRAVVCLCERAVVCRCERVVVCPCERAVVCRCERAVVCPCERAVVCPCERVVVALDGETLLRRTRSRGRGCHSTLPHHYVRAVRRLSRSCRCEHRVRHTRASVALRRSRKGLGSAMCWRTHRGALVERA